MADQPGRVNRALAERVETLTAALEALVDAEIEATEAQTVASMMDVFEAMDRGIAVLHDQTWILNALSEQEGSQVLH